MAISINSFFGLPERSEKVVISTTVDHKIAEGAPDAEKYLRNKKYPLGGVNYKYGDTVKYTYTLNIDYFGDCVKMMLAFVSLKKAGAIMDVEQQVIDHTECLCQKFFEAIQELKK